MSEIGLTFGQLGIGSTAYGDLREFTPPAVQKNIIQHIVPSSTSFPTKDAGYVPGVVSGVMQITALSVDEFIVALATGSAERKISWLHGAVEVYGYAYSGHMTEMKCMNPYGSVTRLYRVGFAIPLSRSIVYTASTDVALWGV